MTLTECSRPVPEADSLYHYVHHGHPRKAAQVRLLHCLRRHPTRTIRRHYGLGYWRTKLNEAMRLSEETSGPDDTGNEEWSTERGPHAQPSADYTSLLPSAREAASFTNGGAELIQSPSLCQRRPIAIKSTFFYQGIIFFLFGRAVRLVGP